MNSTISNRLCRLATCFVLVTMLTACGRSFGDLQVDITKACEQLRSHTSPPEITPDSDYRKLTADLLVRLKTANRKGDRYSACVLSVIDSYARAGQ